MFDQSDANGDGGLSKDEFQRFDKVVNAAGSHLTEAFTENPVDGAYMFPLIDRAGYDFVTRA